jgi:hypothetical protein
MCSGALLRAKCRNESSLEHTYCIRNVRKGDFRYEVDSKVSGPQRVGHNHQYDKAKKRFKMKK